MNIMNGIRWLAGIREPTLEEARAEYIRVSEVGTMAEREKCRAELDAAIARTAGCGCCDGSAK